MNLRKVAGKLGLLKGFQPRVPPKRVPTDTVVPVPFWDDMKICRDFSRDYTYLFNDVLDTRKLQQSLERLMRLGGWRKLGARIRPGRDGRLEYHIPAQYDKERPGFSFTTAEYPMRINDHPLASKLPQATGKLTLQGNAPDECESLLKFDPDHPRVLDDWLYSDRPLLNVHVVSFRDATLVSLSSMHLLGDVMAKRHILGAWSAVLNGNEETVPELRGIDEELMDDARDDTPAKEFVHYEHRLQGWSKFLCIVTAIWERVLYPHEETHVFCIPGAVVDGLRRQAFEEVENDAPNEEKPQFVSESDLLLSWCLQAVLKALKASPGRQVSLCNVFDARANFLRSSVSDKTAIVANAALGSYKIQPACEIQQQPLASLARQIRLSLSQQRTERQCQAQMTARKLALDQTGSDAHYAPGTSLMIGCSNWHRARLYDLDFSSAVLSAGAPLANRRNGLGKPLHFMYRPTSKSGFPRRNMGFVFGKDAAGDWWLCWTLRKQAWPLFRQELERLGQYQKTQ